MLVIGSLCVVSALFIFLSVRDRPVDETDSESPELTADGGPTSLRDDLRSVLGGSDVWALGILNFLILGVNFTIIGLWGVPYLVHLYDLSRRARVAVRPRWQRRPLIGSPLFGWIADRTAAHTALVLISTLVFCVVFGTLSALGTPPLAFVGILFFTAMFVNGGVSLAFTVGRQRHPDEVSGTVSGTINSVGYFGGAAVPAVMGMVLDVFWTGKIVDGTPVYSFTGYRVAFGIATVAGFAALACALWIHQTRRPR